MGIEVKDARGVGEGREATVHWRQGEGERNKRAGHSRYRCCDCVCVSVKYD